jgi:hypothetical protein
LQAETKNLIFSIIGVVIISIVIFEIAVKNMTNMGFDISSTSKKLNQARNSISVPYWIKMAIKGYMENSMFFVVINIYVISININVLNYLLMIFMLKLLLSGRMQRKSIVLIFLANHLTLLSRYIYVIGKENNSTIANLDKDMIAFFGL